MRISKSVAVLTMAIATDSTASLWVNIGVTGRSCAAKLGKLDAKFALCATGKNRSPIDLSGFVEAELKALKLDYKAGIAAIHNHGHAGLIDQAAARPSSTTDIPYKSITRRKFARRGRPYFRIEAVPFPFAEREQDQRQTVSARKPSGACRQGR